jgi:hypothetical protein
LADEPKKRTREVERAAVRLVVPTLLLASTVGAFAVSLHTAKSEIPSVAFGSHVVLAIQVALLFFYGALLLLVPVTRALFDGDLPVELSLRGARWKEDIVDLGDEIADRQAKAEQRALAADLEIKQEVEELRVLLNEIKGTQDADTDEALWRITAFEKRLDTEESGVRISAMAKPDDAPVAESGYIPETVKRRREERDRRMAEISARRSEIKVEPSPGLKELVDSQDEFRERIKELVRRIVSG